MFYPSHVAPAYKPRESKTDMSSPRGPSPSAVSASASASDIATPMPTTPSPMGLVRMLRQADNQDRKDNANASMVNRPPQYQGQGEAITTEAMYIPEERGKRSILVILVSSPQPVPEIVKKRFEVIAKMPKYNQFDFSGYVFVTHVHDGNSDGTDSWALFDNHEMSYIIEAPFVYLINLTKMEQQGKTGALEFPLVDDTNTPLELTHCMQAMRKENQPAILWREKLQLSLLSEFPQNEYQRRVGDLKTCIHWGQRKLLISEIDFLTHAGGNATKVVYIGAAPGNHIPTLSKLFPKMSFDLYDPAPFGIDGTNKISIYNEWFTLETAAKYRSEEVLFISDIRTKPNGGDQPTNEGVEKDMNLQMAIHDKLKPYKALLKFRLPYGKPGVTSYLPGRLRLPVWGGLTTTECRLVVGPWAHRKRENYFNQRYEQQMFYFNTEYRSSAFFCFTDKPEGFCNCFDCTAEMKVLSSYLTIFNTGALSGYTPKELSDSITNSLPGKRTVSAGNLDPEERKFAMSKRAGSKEEKLEKEKIEKALVEYYVRNDQTQQEIFQGLIHEVEEYKRARNNSERADEASDIRVLATMLSFHATFNTGWPTPARVKVILDGSPMYRKKITQRIAETGCPRSPDHHGEGLDHRCILNDWKPPPALKKIEVIDKEEQEVSDLIILGDSPPPEEQQVFSTSAGGLITSESFEEWKDQHSVEIIEDTPCLIVTPPFTAPPTPEVRLGKGRGKGRSQSVPPQLGKGKGRGNPFLSGMAPYSRV